MSRDELVRRLLKFKGNYEVQLLNHSCLEAYPEEITSVRRAKKRESNIAMEDELIVID